MRAGNPLQRTKVLGRAGGDAAGGELVLGKILRELINNKIPKLTPHSRCTNTRNPLYCSTVPARFRS